MQALSPRSGVQTTVIIEKAAQMGCNGNQLERVGLLFRRFAPAAILAVQPSLQMAAR